MGIPANKITKRGVYGCYDGNKLVYVGSTTCSLWKLEQNHRKAFSLGYTISFFRENLMDYGRNWVFKWLVEPYECNQKEIETQEGQMIREHDTKYNLDKDPVASSIKYGRYK